MWRERRVRVECAPQWSTTTTSSTSEPQKNNGNASFSLRQRLEQLVSASLTQGPTAETTFQALDRPALPQHECSIVTVPPAPSPVPEPPVHPAPFVAAQHIPPYAPLRSAWPEPALLDLVKQQALYATDLNLVPLEQGVESSGGPGVGTLQAIANEALASVTNSPSSTSSQLVQLLADVCSRPQAPCTPNGTTQALTGGLLWGAHPADPLRAGSIPAPPGHVSAPAAAAAAAACGLSPVPALDTVPLGAPSALVGFEGDWLAVSPPVLQHWEKVSLEPYGPQKAVHFYVVCPEQHVSAARLFFKDLSSTFSSMRLGTHQPGRTPANVHSLDGIIPVPLESSPQLQQLQGAGPQGPASPEASEPGPGAPGWNPMARRVDRTALRSAVLGFRSNYGPGSVPGEGGWEAPDEACYAPRRLGSGGCVGAALRKDSLDGAGEGVQGRGHAVTGAEEQQGEGGYAGGPLQHYWRNLRHVGRQLQRHLLLQPRELVSLRHAAAGPGLAGQAGAAGSTGHGCMAARTPSSAFATNGPTALAAAAPSGSADGLLDFGPPALVVYVVPPSERREDVLRALMEVGACLAPATPAARVAAAPVAGVAAEQLQQPGCNASGRGRTEEDAAERVPDRPLPGATGPVDARMQQQVLSFNPHQQQQQQVSAHRAGTLLRMGSSACAGSAQQAGSCAAGVGVGTGLGAGTTPPEPPASVGMGTGAGPTSSSNGCYGGHTSMGDGQACSAELQQQQQWVHAQLPELLARLGGAARSLYRPAGGPGGCAAGTDGAGGCGAMAKAGGAAGAGASSHQPQLDPRQLPATEVTIQLLLPSSLHDITGTCVRATAAAAYSKLCRRQACHGAAAAAAAAAPASASAGSTTAMAVHPAAPSYRGPPPDPGLADVGATPGPSSSTTCSLPIAGLVPALQGVRSAHCGAQGGEQVCGVDAGGLEGAVVACCSGRSAHYEPLVVLAPEAVVSEAVRQAQQQTCDGGGSSSGGLGGGGAATLVDQHGGAQGAEAAAAAAAPSLHCAYAWQTCGHGSGSGPGRPHGGRERAERCWLAVTVTDGLGEVLDARVLQLQALAPAHSARCPLPGGGEAGTCVVRERESTGRRLAGCGGEGPASGHMEVEAAGDAATGRLEGLVCRAVLCHAQLVQRQVAARRGGVAGRLAVVKVGAPTAAEVAEWELLQQQQQQQQHHQDCPQQHQAQPAPGSGAASPTEDAGPEPELLPLPPPHLAWLELHAPVAVQPSCRLPHGGFAVRYAPCGSPARGEPLASAAPAEPKGQEQQHVGAAAAGSGYPCGAVTICAFPTQQPSSASCYALEPLDRAVRLLSVHPWPAVPYGVRKQAGGRIADLEGVGGDVASAAGLGAVAGGHATLKRSAAGRDRPWEAAEGQGEGTGGLQPRAKRLHSGDGQLGAGGQCEQLRCGAGVGVGVGTAGAVWDPVGLCRELFALCVLRDCVLMAQSGPRGGPSAGVAAAGGRAAAFARGGGAGAGALLPLHCGVCVQLLQLVTACDRVACGTGHSSG